MPRKTRVPKSEATELTQRMQNIAIRRYETERRLAQLNAEAATLITAGRQANMTWDAIGRALGTSGGQAWNTARHTHNETENKP